MGGCGGKKQRERQKAASTIGGKFDSTGKSADHKANCALVTAKVGEILGMLQDAPHGHSWADTNDRLFMQDVRIKLNQYGSNAVFGWRQVEAVVALHGRVQAKWKEHRADKG